MMTVYHTAQRGACRVREGIRPADDEPSNSDPVRAIRFPLGRVLATPGALAALAESWEGGSPWPATPDDCGDVLAWRALRDLLLILPYVQRHGARDWGDVDAADAAMNESALGTGGRLLSAYTLSSGRRLWIITEADRSATTVLLPEEY
jgi:hypothetical protein